MSPAIFVLACFACPPSAVGSSSVSFDIAFDAQVERQQQGPLRGGHFAWHAQPLRARGDRLRLFEQFVDLLLDVERRLARGVGQRREQRLGDLRVRIPGRSR